MHIRTKTGFVSYISTICLRKS